MKVVQRHDTWFDFVWALIRVLYYFIALPSLLFIAAATLVGMFGKTMLHADGQFYLFSLFVWLAILFPLGVRHYGKVCRRRVLNQIVTMLTRPDRFNPQKQHQVMDAGRGKYLGIDTKNGNILYIHMVKKGVIDVVGLDMRSWTNRELEGSALRLNTRMPDVPVLSVTAHPIVAKELFNTLGAMNHNRYTEPFPQEPWPLYVAHQSNFVEYEHNVVVPQAV
ncbi:plasmid IncI1-type surface exclusion protein ExcA [Rahnella sp. BCC 1045]|uniref:plasmid IncI1-type surface exclusion protein ExcA n=1 Tax=Rahnella sp. BCC 1045 TaxID=2816251 RepID=UPI001C267CC9|nr:plasmid IncI1-type surface exclusion protein ExcA [Rahnella sp. BCC 1045]MBU9819648.1 plasmid IncI1-type surface exclusion protein ExcA [Rahnella sp. BCC 1045]